jgi:uncharacterized protein YcnI
MLFSLSPNTRKLPEAIIFTLALTSLFTCGIGITNSNSAVAVPQAAQVQPATNTLPKAIANAVLRDASRRSGAKIPNLQISQATATSFSNSCMFRFGEICTKEYKPIQGWVVAVNVKGQPWTYHVNKPGSQILLDPKISTNQQLPPKIREAVVSDAAKRAGLPVNAVKITQSTQKTFSNSCVFNFGEICTQQYDPVEGWEVIVKVKGKSWTYHVDTTGSRIVLDPKASN